jgi:hypothetical protein
MRAVDRSSGKTAFTRIFMRQSKHVAMATNLPGAHAVLLSESLVRYRKAIMFTEKHNGTKLPETNRIAEDLHEHQ